MKRLRPPPGFGWSLVVASTVLVLVLGIWGSHIDLQSSGKAPKQFDISYTCSLFYRSLQLFVLEFNPANSDKPAVPPQLDIARWLAAAVAGVALWKAAAQLFAEKWHDQSLRRLRRHVIVCGLGRKGFQLVQQLAARGDSVVVIERDELDDNLVTCRELGIHVLIGDATSGVLLSKAGVEHAARLIAVCRNDSDNIEIALQARDLVRKTKRLASDPLTCHVHIIDLKLAELFRHHKAFSCTGDPFDARIFSFYENSARELLSRRPLDATWDNRPATLTARFVHLVIVGFGQMGESVALQAARVGHFASGKRLRLTIIDPDAEGLRLNLLSRYGQIENVCELTFESASVEDLRVRQILSDWAADPGQHLVIAICVDDDPRALSIALNLPDAIAEHLIPVFVRQSERRGLSALVNERGGAGDLAAHVSSFGAPEISASLETILQEKLDRLARAIHESYVEQRIREGHRNPDDPAQQAWEQLDAAFKSSNRQQADHIDVKLRTIHCRRAPRGESPASFAGFSLEEVEVLAKMEHARWCADRFLSGWKYGEQIDKPRRISPYLVPWSELAEEIRERDRQAVRQIPHLLSLIDEIIVREGAEPPLPA